MNNSKTSIPNTGLIQSIVLFMLLIMFSFSGFAQSSNISFDGKQELTNVKLENSKATSNMEFAVWFMGSKQDPNATFSVESSNAKKLIITSGIAPNRLLLKAFLKKVVNYENSLS